MKTTNSINIGNRIKSLRLALGLTVREFAKNIGVSPATISLIENGKRMPQDITVAKICEFLGITSYEFYNVEISPKKIRNNFVHGIKSQRPKLYDDFQKYISNSTIIDRRQLLDFIISCLNKEDYNYLTGQAISKMLTIPVMQKKK